LPGDIRSRSLEGGEERRDHKKLAETGTRGEVNQGESRLGKKEMVALKGSNMKLKW